MKITVERLPESQVRLDIISEDTEFSDAMEKAYRKVTRDIQVPGFRKGKVPRQMIERMFGREIFVNEAHRGLMDDLYRQALKQEEIVPVGDPEVEIVAPEPLEFTVLVPVYPTIDPGDYKSVRVDPVDASIEDSQIDEVVERLRLRSSSWSEPDEPRTPHEGDQVTVDLTMTDENGEKFQDDVNDAVFILGESDLFEGIRSAIESLSVGESTETTIAFDDDDDAIAERLRGQALTYHITLKALKERKLLALDDEFAKTYGGEDSVTELRAAIREDLHANRTNEARNEVMNAIVAKIAEGATAELPVTMVDDAVNEEVARMRTRLQYQRLTLEAYLRANNQTEEQLREELRPSVVTRLRNSMILREIAQREGIAVAPEELEAEIEDLVTDAPDPGRARAVYRADGYMRTMLSNDLFDRKLSDALIASATEGRGGVTGGWDRSMRRERKPKAEQTPANESAESTAAIGLATVTTEDGLPSGAHAPSDSGACPDGFPIKGNASSLIYHAPGTRFFEATEPEICFATAEDAEAAGYRAPHGSTGSDE